jgi:hypothetical protein
MAIPSLVLIFKYGNSALLQKIYLLICLRNRQCFSQAILKEMTPIHLYLEG